MTSPIMILLPQIPFCGWTVGGGLQGSTVERSVTSAADVDAAVSQTMLMRRVTWPLLSQYVCFLAIKGSSIAG